MIPHMITTLEIIFMVFININHSYDSTHDSSPAVRIIVTVLVNKNHSFDSGHDFYTHHKIMWMIKSSLINNDTMMIWVQNKSCLVVL